MRIIQRVAFIWNSAEERYDPISADDPRIGAVHWNYFTVQECLNQVLKGEPFRATYAIEGRSGHYFGLGYQLYGYVRRSNRSHRYRTS